MRSFWFMAMNMLLLLATGLIWLIFGYEDSTAYLFPHEGAKVYFDEYHGEGYEAIESVTYIGAPKVRGNYPSKMKGVINGEETTSDIIEHALMDVDPTFNLNLFGCPEGLSAKRTEEGWVYEVTPKIQSHNHRKSIEACIGITIAGVYEVSKVLREAHAEEIKADQERKSSWENAPRPTT